MNCPSSFETNTSGIPQGSILSIHPRFLVILINDLSENCTNSQVLLFADATKITTKCLYEPKNDPFRQQDWAFETKMVFNADNQS